MRIFAQIGNLVIYQCKTLDEISDVVSKQIIASVNANRKHFNIGFTHSRQLLGLYDELVKDHKVNKTKYRKVHFYLLDEYVAMDQKVKYLSNDNFLTNKLYHPLRIPRWNRFSPIVGMDDYEFSRYDRMIWADGGLNLTILDLGNKGQIAFNEANTNLTDLTRVVRLSKELREQKSLRFGNEINVTPSLGVTTSMLTIMNSERIIMVAASKIKADALKLILAGKYDEKYPCTYLLNHRNASIYIDDELARAVKR